MDFPSEEVYEAYSHPVVDESTEQFEWGKPDLHSLRLYPLNQTSDIIKSLKHSLKETRIPFW